MWPGLSVPCLSINRVERFEPTIGRWWVDTTPESKVAGYLELDPDEPSLPWRLTVEGEIHPHPGTGHSKGLTIFGDTPLGKYTLRTCVPTWMYGLGDRSDMQRWGGVMLLQGDHASEDAKYTQATFRLPHLWNWIGPSPLNYHTMGARRHATVPSPNDELQWLEAELPNGMTVGLARMFTRSVTPGGRHKSTEGYGVYRLAAEAGFTLDKARIVADGLARLYSLVTSKPMETFDMSIGGGRNGRTTVVDPRSPAGEDWDGIQDPYFDTDEIDFPAFVGEWIRLHTEAAGVGAAVDPGRSRTFVTSMLIDGCNAVEALANRCWTDGPGELRPEDQAVIALLAEARVHRDTRRGIQRYLRQRRWSLQAKLERAAESLGPDSAAWLLGPSVSDWAHLISRLRNSVAHGSSLPDGLDGDMSFVLLAHESLNAVLTLTLFKQCGYTNRLSKISGELLRSGGKSIVSHPNSGLSRELEEIASRSGEWAEWRRRLDGRSDGEAD